MTGTVDTGVTFLVLHALAVKGVAKSADLVEITGLAAGDVDTEVARLLEAEMLRERRGKLGGYALVEAGKADHRSLLAGDVDDAARAALAETYDAFLAPNGVLKDLCTRWQLRAVGGAPEPNDHSDPVYDEAVIAELVTLHGQAVALLAPAAAALPRFGRYPDRLSRALDRLQGGEIGAFTKPLTHSYHDVWMELHQDLLSSLGRDRNAADEG